MASLVKFCIMFFNKRHFLHLFFRLRSTFAVRAVTASTSPRRVLSAAGCAASARPPGPRRPFPRRSAATSALTASSWLRTERASPACWAPTGRRDSSCLASGAQTRPPPLGEQNVSVQVHFTFCHSSVPLAKFDPKVWRTLHLKNLTELSNPNSNLLLPRVLQCWSKFNFWSELCQIQM